MSNNNTSTKRIVSRDDDTMTFVITCKSHDDKNAIFDVTTQRHIETIVYRAIANDDTKRNASITRYVNALRIRTTMFAQRNDTTRVNELFAHIDKFDAMTNDDDKLTHVKNIVAKYASIYASMS